MFQKTVLRQDIEAVISASKSTDPLLSEKRELGLQFMIDARPTQSLADIANIFNDLSGRFEVKPLLPSPPFPPKSPDQAPTWTDTIFVATLCGVAFDDVSAHPWDIAHALRKEGGFVRVIPEVPVPNPEIIPDAELEITSRPDGWEHEAMRIKGAWDEIFRSGKLPGSGVLIGHPDTGWVPHEVFTKENLDPDKGWNFVEEGQDSTDPLTDRGRPGIANPGHGTHIASVMIAPKNTRLTGVAPNATVVPIRAVKGVILNFRTTPFIRAVKHAINMDCQVISISLGGRSLGNDVRRAISDAVRANCIVVAASGNKNPISRHNVVQPALYSECIAVAGTQPQDEGWEDAAWQPANTVDISAPAKPVLSAKADQQSPTDYFENGEGTSYATAYLAGIAALWLSYHFEATRPAQAQERFRAHVKREALLGLPRERYFGSVNAEQLIKTAPPTEEETIVQDLPDFTAVSEVVRLIGNESTEQVRHLIARTILGQHKILTEEDNVFLEVWADEIMDILQLNPDLSMKISNKIADSVIVEKELRSFLALGASDALREQLDAAQKAEDEEVQTTSP